MAVTNLGRVAFNPRGEYILEETYKKLDFVTSLGSAYVYINPEPAAGVSVTDATHWQQIAAKGDSGVYVGTAEPTDPLDKVWIDADDPYEYGSNMAASMGIADSEGYYAGNNVETALTEVGGAALAAYYYKSNGVDDTTAFQAAIVTAQSTGRKIILVSDIIITDEILIDRAVWIEGNGLAGHNHSRANSKITFTNSTVDGGGNATKCLFRVDVATYNYRQMGLTLKNIDIVHTNTTALHQHSLIFSGESFFTYSVLDRLSIYGCTGYGIYLDSATATFPYAHQIYWSNIGFRNVGGGIGRSPGTTPWIALGKVDNMWLEDKINSVSPEEILFDLTGWINVDFNSIIVEGNASAISATATIFKINSSLRINNLWVELVSGYPEYILDITDGDVDVNHMYATIGYNGTQKIKVSGRARLTLDSALGRGFNDSIEISDTASIKCKNYSTDESLHAVSDKQGDMPRVKDTQIGRLKIEHASSYYSSSTRGNYTDERYVELYRKGNGFIRNTANNVVSFGFPTSLTDATERQEMVNDATEGKVIKIVTAYNTLFPDSSLYISAPAFAGSTVIIGLRYKIVTADTASRFCLFGCNFITEEHMHINMIAQNAWENGYVVISNFTGTVVLYPAEYQITEKHTIYISEIVVSLGDKLPSMSTKRGVKEIIDFSTTCPAYGYFTAGDIIYKSNPSIVNIGGTNYHLQGWRRVTAGTDNVLGTDWMAIYTPVL